MRSKTIFLCLGICLAFWGANPGVSFAKTAGFCVECHSSKSMNQRNAYQMAERHSVYQTKLDPCPGLQSMGEEIFFTERRINQVNQILDTLDQKGWATGAHRKSAAEDAESWSKLKREENASYGLFSKEAFSIRASLQKVYDRTVQARDESSRRWLIGLGSLIFVIFCLLLGVSFRKLKGMNKSFLLLLALGSLSLTACSSTVAEPQKKSAGQEKLEQNLIVAAQNTAKLEESSYQSILIAEMAREWAGIEAAPAEKALQLSWDMALAARKKGGEIAGQRELLSRWPDPASALKDHVNFDAVLDLRDEIRLADGRLWALRAVAEEWAQINAKKGRDALDWVTREALGMKDLEMRDRELRSLAYAWSEFDRNRALEISRSIGNPFLRAVAIADLARLNQGEGTFSSPPDLCREAWKIGESISDPYLQVRAFIKISALGALVSPQGKKAWAEQVLGTIQKLENPELQGMARNDLVAKWGAVDLGLAEGWAGEISPADPSARGYAFIRLAGIEGISKAKAVAFLKTALEEASRVADAMDSQKIMTLALLDLAKLEPEETLRGVPEIKDPYFRSEILSRVVLQFAGKDKGKARDLAEKIPLESIRYGVTARIIRGWAGRDQERIVSLCREAGSAAALIADPHLRSLWFMELAKIRVQMGQGKEGSALTALALKSAGGISSPSLKAEILEMAADLLKETDKKRAQALLAGIDPSVIRARKYLEEIRLLAKADPEKAFQLARELTSGFPMEKALALKEVAGTMIKTQPAQAYAIFEAAFAQALALPEGPKREKLLTQIVAGATVVDKEKTLQKLRQISERPLRDNLLKEAGNVWAVNDILFAMKTASEIGESSLRVALYQKITEEAAKKIASGGKIEAPSPILITLAQWGEGRGKAKKEETQAAPFYEDALQGIEKIADPKEKAYLLGALAADWAGVDENKALAVAEKIAAKFPEPYSYALLKAGAQLGKWNRQEAEVVFQKTFAATDSLQDSSLKGQRLLQLAREWRLVNREKGQKVLSKALTEARKIKGDPVFVEALFAWIAWEPENTLTIGKGLEDPLVKARVLAEGARVLSKKFIEENKKPLEKALQFAQGTKRSTLMSEIGQAWYTFEPDKGLELIRQVEMKKIRVKALFSMAQKRRSVNKEESKYLLDLATEEALKMEILPDQVQWLRKIARDWGELDRKKAKKTYLRAYQVAERTYHSSPQFVELVKSR